jgi:hypothetical protein
VAFVVKHNIWDNRRYGKYSSEFAVLSRASDGAHESLDWVYLRCD